MSLLRSERASAALLLGAAVLGLVLTNSPVGPGLLAVKASHLDAGLPGLDLSVGHWVSDGLLALFFFVVAVDLKHELLRGQLNSPSKAVVPAIAAVGGVAVPALVFALLTRGTPYTGGWPVPTATDIAFALGVLAVFGAGLPGRIRVFLLALAVLDDLIAIVIIAVFFTHGSDLLFLGLAVVALVAVAAAGRLLRRFRGSAGLLIVALVCLLAVIAWYFVLRSGVHATIAAVVVGLVLPLAPARRAVHALEPVTNGFVLPLFAFAAAAVVVPAVGIGELSPVFWAIVVALPVGKLIGITAAGAVAGRVFGRGGRGRARGRTSSLDAVGAAVDTSVDGARSNETGGATTQTLSMPELVTVAMLGGIGFTVSLLMNELAFARSEEIVDEGTLAVLVGSGISVVIAGVLVSALARAHRRSHSRRMR